MLVTIEINRVVVTDAEQQTCKPNFRNEVRMQMQLGIFCATYSGCSTPNHVTYGQQPQTEHRDNIKRTTTRNVTAETEQY